MAFFFFKKATLRRCSHPIYVKLVLTEKQPRKYEEFRFSTHAPVHKNNLNATQNIMTEKRIWQNSSHCEEVKES